MPNLSHCNKSNFFNAVKETYPGEWSKPDSVLRKTIGFTALTRIMSPLVEAGLNGGDLSKTYFANRLAPYADLNFDRIQLSSKGIKQLVDLFQETH
jgi:hypothetical protein